MQEILQVEQLHKTFRVKVPEKVFGFAELQAVNRVSFSVRGGEIFGLVGESGSGKSTTALCVIRVHEPDSGQIKFDGNDITHLSETQIRPLRKDIQMVFQDPTESLNPRMTVEQIVLEALSIYRVGSRAERIDLLKETLGAVGLKTEHRNRYPHQLSTGQRQRVGLARAMVLRPKFVILDEPTSALDVSVRGQVLELLMKLRERFDLSYLFISHDLNVVRHICTRIAVMYLGSIMEIGKSGDIFNEPLHPYSQALISAIPRIKRHPHAEPTALKGEIPSPFRIPSGCPFSTRCPYVGSRCKEEVPKLLPISDRFVACHLVAEDNANSDYRKGGVQ